MGEEMDKKFFQQIIKELPNEKLINLLQKTRNEFNKDVFQLAKEEAERGNLEFELVDTTGRYENKSSDLKKLRRWNWGAFLLTPIWTLPWL
jgi:hypothetical protein